MGGKWRFDSERSWILHELDLKTYLHELGTN
jgi:hypothetical protein